MSKGTEANETPYERKRIECYRLIFIHGDEPVYISKAKSARIKKDFMAGTQRGSYEAIAADVTGRLYFYTIHMSLDSVATMLEGVLIYDKHHIQFKKKEVSL